MLILTYSDQKPLHCVVTPDYSYHKNQKSLSQNKPLVSNAPFLYPLKERVRKGAFEANGLKISLMQVKERY